MLKKIVCGLLITAFLFAMYSCDNREMQVRETVKFNPEEPVTICFDLDGSIDGRHYSMNESYEFKFTGAKIREVAINKLIQDIKAQGGPENVTVEIIEGQGEEREGALTRDRKSTRLNSSHIH